MDFPPLSFQILSWGYLLAYTTKWPKNCKLGKHLSVILELRILELPTLDGGWDSWRVVCAVGARVQRGL